MHWIRLGEINTVSTKCFELNNSVAFWATVAVAAVSARGPFLIGSYDRFWDKAVISDPGDERRFLAEAAL